MSDLQMLLSFKVSSYVSQCHPILHSVIPCYTVSSQVTEFHPVFKVSNHVATKLYIVSLLVPFLTNGVLTVYGTLHSICMICTIATQKGQILKCTWYKDILTPSEYILTNCHCVRLHTCNLLCLILKVNEND